MTLDGSSSSDPDGDALTFEWRDEASQVVGNSAVVSLSLPLGVHAFTLTVSDAGCGQDTATVRITVRDDGAPTITISSPVAGVYELGQPVVAQYACADAVSGVASCSGTVPNGAPVPTGTAGAHLFEVSAADGAGNNATATVSYQVSKGVPRIEWTNPAPILVGTPLGAVQLNATASVPGAFVYSPPAGTVLGVGVGQLLTATFEPADATNYASVVATATITVLPLPVDAVPPEVSNLVATPNPVAAGVSALTLTARIDDSATGASRVVTGQYRIDGGAWVQMAVADGAFDSAIETVTASVGPFPAAGVREICVRGGDAAGNLGGDTCTLVAIYDPNAGYVAGHGWIDSPPGAYPSDPTLGGRAQFAFTSKYAKGASVPTGSTEFKFKAAGFSFSSTVYEWLVVSGAKAQYRGQGAVNGVGGFRFFLSAIDGDVSGGQGVDRFRIRIWSRIKPFNCWKGSCLRRLTRLQAAYSVRAARWPGQNVRKRAPS